MSPSVSKRMRHAASSAAALSVQKRVVAMRAGTSTSAIARASIRFGCPPPGCNAARRCWSGHARRQMPGHLGKTITCSLSSPADRPRPSYVRQHPVADYRQDHALRLTDPAPPRVRMPREASSAQVKHARPVIQSPLVLAPKTLPENSRLHVRRR